jgi:peptide/nickel transport system permease protein
MEFLKRYLIPRIVQYLTVMLIGITVVFLIPRLSPTDPVNEALGRMTAQGATMDPEVLEELQDTIEELYGLTGSNWEQYLRFWSRLLRGDFGPSFSQFPTPVGALIRQSMPWTLGLLLASTLLAWIFGTIIGGLAGFFSGKRWVRILEVVFMTLRPLPYYIMAIAMVILFAYLIPVFPLAGGYSIGTVPSFSLDFILDVVFHAFLPALSLILVGIGSWFLQMRSMSATVVGEDYVQFAESAGLPRRKIIFSYTIRNAMLPQITGLALSLGMIFGGALITEQVFSFPGIGSLLYTGILMSDYNLIMGVTIFSIFAIATAVLVIDLIYPLFDPRVRYR